MAKIKREEVIMRKKNKGGKGFALGALVGGLFGGMTALLFAPKSGEKMRRDLAKKCHKATDKAQCMVDEVCEGTSKLYKKAKTMAWDAKDTASKILKRK
jgi:gas vesicle protein